MEEFIKYKQNVKKILAQLKAPLRDAAAVNTTRYAIGNALKALGLPTTFASGGLTKFNRTQQGYPKDHWIDAACVGNKGRQVHIPQNLKPLTITATGRGIHQVVNVDKYGFPRAKAGRIKRIHGFQTGDSVKLLQPKGKYAGSWQGRLAGVRADGRFDIHTQLGKVTSVWKNFSLLQRTDGYSYVF